MLQRRRDYTMAPFRCWPPAETRPNTLQHAVVPPAAVSYGFMIDAIGAHGSRTMILAELRDLLSSCSPSATTDAYRAAIVDANVLRKSTFATRRESFRRLRELYALSPEVLLFRALRDLWDADADAQPLLALLCAVARDPWLRATAPAVLAAAPSAPVTPRDLAAAFAAAYPGRYSAITQASVGRHAASTWRQSGHLAGRTNKVRTHADCRPAAVAYALVLGQLCEARGAGLFTTFWAALLDADDPTLQDQAVAASRQGWLEYRAAGAVRDVAFAYLLRNTNGNGEGRR